MLICKYRAGVVRDESWAHRVGSPRGSTPMHEPSAPYQDASLVVPRNGKIGALLRSISSRHAGSTKASDIADHPGWL